jgi:hypothetical protein
MRIKILLKGMLFSCLLSCLFLSAHAQSGTAKPVADEWTRYELAKGSISVLLPAKPTEEFKPSPPDLAVSIDMSVYSVERPNGVFVAQHCLLGEVAESWSEAAVEAFYNGLWDGASKGLNNMMQKNGSELRVVLLEKRKTTFSGYDGREISYRLGPLKGRIIMSVIGREAFTAMVLRTDEMTVEEQDKFLNSYTIKAAPRVKKTVSTSNPNQ